MHQDMTASVAATTAALASACRRTAATAAPIPPIAATAPAALTPCNAYRCDTAKTQNAAAPAGASSTAVARAIQRTGPVDFAITAPTSAASAGTIGKIYKSSLVPDSEKKTTIAAIQMSRRRATRLERSRNAHHSPIGMNSDHGNRSANITGM